MAQAVRSIGSAMIQLAMVMVPVKLFTAQSPKEIAFNKLVAATGNRTKQQILDAGTGKVVESSELVLGYEYTEGQFVRFTKEELEALEAESRPGEIRIKEVVPLATLDTRYLGKAILLGPDKGAARPFSLIAKLLSDRASAFVGQRGSTRRDDLIVIRAQDKALVMHECLYAEEIRSITETVAPVDFTHSPEELELAGKLFREIEMPAFDARRFIDRGAERVLAAVEQKKAKKEIVMPSVQPIGGVAVDLLEQLRLSLRKPIGGTKKTNGAVAPASQVVAKKKRGGRSANA